MTQAADSTAGSPARRASQPQAPHGESERARAFGESSAPQPQTPHLPVFAAFDELGFSGRDIAALADVTAPTVSKWRSGRVRIPAERVAFLSLVLAHFLDEAKAAAEIVAQCVEAQGSWSTARMGRLDAARAYLAYQDVLNRDLPAADVREGARRFREWWAGGGAKDMERKHCAPQLDADLVETLKNKVKERMR